MKNYKTLKRNLKREMNFYKIDFIDFIFNKKFSDFFNNEYFSDYRKSYLSHNNLISKRNYCLPKGYRTYSCEFCEYIPYTNKIISKYNFYFDNDIKELLNEFE